MWRREGVKKEDMLHVRWLQSMQKLDVQDGDILVIRLNTILFREAHERYRSAVKEIMKRFGYDIHVIVLEGCSEIGILRKESK
jgi:hypothetical protein